MRNYDQFYINGEWVDPVEAKSLDVINPATEEVCGTISLGSAADVDKAAKAEKTRLKEEERLAKKADEITAKAAAGRIREEEKEKSRKEKAERDSAKAIERERMKAERERERENQKAERERKLEDTRKLAALEKSQTGGNISG